MKKRLGIIIPYRDRSEHLGEYIPYMEDYLKDIQHKIYVIEQRNTKPFNRGKLLNVGYKVSKSNSDYICLHDVDLLPENVDYSYVESMKQLSIYVEQFDYKKKWDIGGVTLFNKDTFEKINGYSNEYVGWGAEDSCLKYRCERAGITISRDVNGGRFKSLSHVPNGDNRPGGLSKLSRINRERYNYLIKNGKYPDGKSTEDDGLNTLEYSIVEYLDHNNCEYYGVEV